jgi:hypothetical protein
MASLLWANSVSKKEFPLTNEVVQWNTDQSFQWCHWLSLRFKFASTYLHLDMHNNECQIKVSWVFVWDHPLVLSSEVNSSKVPTVPTWLCDNLGHISFQLCTRTFQPLFSVLWYLPVKVQIGTLNAVETLELSLWRTTRNGICSSVIGFSTERWNYWSYEAHQYYTYVKMLTI